MADQPTERCELVGAVHVHTRLSDGSGRVEDVVDAARKWEMHICAGVLERDGKVLYNTSLLVNPVEVVLKYRKIHLFLDEKDIFKAGDKPPEVAKFEPATGKGKGACVGMLICFDWTKPGAWNYLARKGAEIICHPANLVLEGKCEKGIPVRAMENRVFIITSDRVGVERGLEFVGGSQIVDPDGNILSKAPAKGEHFDIVTINPELARNKYITPRNHVFDDARWELYPPVDEEEK